MTTSRETDWMDHPHIRRLVDDANRSLSLPERLTLLKGLVPGVADEMTPDAYRAFMDELRLKGERFYEAKAHPGEGRESRRVPGEREVERRGG